mgnify:FL=1
MSRPSRAWRSALLPAVFLAAATLLAPRPASAWKDHTRTYDEDWHMDLQAQTELPLQVGGRITLETPYRLRVSTSMGWLPPAYLDLVNVVMVAAGAYKQSTADLLSASLDDALIWKIRLGWRPFKDHGFYFEAGYALATLGGGMGAEELITAATGKKLDPLLGLADKEYDLDATLHMIDVELGWIWLVAKDALSIRLEVGFTATLGASATVTPRFTPPAAARDKVADWTRQAADYLERTCRTYVMTPVIGLGIGWRPM